MEKCIIDLASAIGKVESDYVKVIGFDFNDEEYLQSAEQAFTAELYHQFKLIIECDKTSYYKKVKLQFDLEKKRFGGKRPDMVLHTSPLSREDQRLYIEVKTNSKLMNYDKDLAKILIATAPNNNENELGFKNAVFIVGKKPYNDVIRIIKEYFVKKNLIKDTRLNQIYLIHFNLISEITIKEFKDII